MSAPLLEVEGLRMHFFTRAGVVKAVHVAPGQAVDKGALLVTLSEPAGDAPGPAAE